MNLTKKYVKDQEEKKPVRIVVTLEGGIVQNVLSDIPVEVIVLDYDTEDCDPEEDLINVYDNVSAAHRELDAEINNAFVDSIFSEVNKKA